MRTRGVSMQPITLIGRSIQRFGDVNSRSPNTLAFAFTREGADNRALRKIQNWEQRRLLQWWCLRGDLFSPLKEGCRPHHKASGVRGSG